MTINHGANLFNLAENLNIDKKDILDFSSNINPFGSSLKAKKAVIDNIDLVSIYPDPDYRVLKNSISKYCNCSENSIVLGSGATELISKYISLIHPKKSLLLAPSYSEYEHELQKVSCSIERLFAKKEDNFRLDCKHVVDYINKNNYDIVIICNPNNPTGFAFTKEEIKYMAENTSSSFMIDETYIEFTDKSTYSCSSIIDECKNIFVIRGTSKFFSTPGIRLGYGLTSHDELNKELSKIIDLWNINIFASLMGEVMFTDSDYINSTTDKMLSEREYLMSALKEFKEFKAYDTYGNFILCEITSKKITAKELYDKLMEKGIIIRNCSSFSTLEDYFFRVCTLKHDDNKRLITELSQIFN